jgi:ABC-type uncharacterized transport system involved in gliding motility auxiliary subunit
MRRKTQEIVVLILIGACLAFALADSARFYVRADLTRNRAYTLSPVSRDILRQVPEQIHVIYFLSDTLRALSPAPGRVIELLQEYAAGSRGKVSVSVVDPLREGRAESARRFGVMPQQIQVIEQNQQRTVDVFSGIVVEYLDRYTTLPGVFTPDGLEFNLGFAIRKLVAGKRLAVGVIVGRPDKLFARDYENLRTGLSRDYWLREFAPGERVPPEVDVLLVLGGTGISPAELRPVDRYVMDGGKVLFAVKGLRVETTRSFSAASIGESALLNMLETYGVRVGRGMVLDTAARDYRLPQQSGAAIAWETLGRYPPWVSIRSPGVSGSNPITASFSGLDLLWPSLLEPVPVAEVRAEVLAAASPAAWVMKDPMLVDPYRVPQSGAGWLAAPGARALAVALTGSFPSAFAGAAGAAGSGSEPARSQPTRIVAVGDDDFATDLMQFSDSLYNVLFVENCVLWLSGNADLLSLKTRSAADPRLDRIADPVARGRVMLAAEVLNVVIVPLLVLCFGLLRMRARKRNA